MKQRAPQSQPTRWMTEPAQVDEISPRLGVPPKDMTTKTCKTCRVEKELKEFRAAAACSQGVRPNCKLCMKAAENVKREKMSAIAATTLKTCRVCKVEQKMTSFYINLMYRDGVLPTCGACMRAKAAERVMEKEVDVFTPPSPPRSRLRIRSAPSAPSVAEGAT